MRNIRDQVPPRVADLGSSSRDPPPIGASPGVVVAVTWDRDPPPIDTLSRDPPPTGDVAHRGADGQEHAADEPRAGPHPQPPTGGRWWSQVLDCDRFSSHSAGGNPQRLGHKPPSSFPGAQCASPTGRRPYLLKFSADKIDVMVIQAIGLLDDLDKELNIYAMRVKEWSVLAPRRYVPSSKFHEGYLRIMFVEGFQSKPSSNHNDRFLLLCIFSIRLLSLFLYIASFPPQF